MRPIAILLALCVGAVLVRATWHARAPQITPVTPTVVVRLVFGLKDEAPTDWSGSVTGANVDSIEGWRFLGGQGDVMRPRLNAWTAHSHLEPIEPLPLSQPNGVPVTPARRTPQPVGVTLTLGAPAPERLQIQTAQGAFEVRPADLRLGAPAFVLDGRARVERIPSALSVAETPAQNDSPVSGSPVQNDYPALAATQDGGLWIVWAAYQNRADQVFCRHFDGQGWGEPEAVSPQPGDVNHPACAVDGRGRLWVVWSAQANGNWDLWARRRDANGWAAPERLTRAPEPDIEPRLIANAQGRLLLAWQGFRNGQTQILARVLEGDRWGAEQRVSDGDADNWDPALAADSRGAVAVAWDTYQGGNYNIRLRFLRDGRWSVPRPVTAGPRFHAHASLAYGPDNQLWIAWDESGPNWGKDYGFTVHDRGTRLYQGRQIRIAVWPAETGAAGPDALRMPAADIHTVLPENSVVICEMPQLAFDRAGRLWTLFRRRTARTPRIDGWTAGGVWEIYATACDGSTWSVPFALEHATGRNDMRVAFATDTQGRLWTAWATDHRSWQMPAPKITAVQMATLDDPAVHGPISQALGGPLPVDNGAVAAVHPHEAEDVARVRNYRIVVDGKRYRILRGDLHRHTDNSPDGAGDGSLEDLYRYAMDAAGMDYILVTDHNDGNDAEYPWWRREKSNDLYLSPGHFVPLYGYERSVPYPNGHRNVMFAQRGVRTLPIGPQENRGQVNTGPLLYPYLRTNKGIATSHTSATDQGTDWRDNDPDLEPIVEIFQGYALSSEHAGAPRAENAQAAQIHGVFRPDGFVWNALARGYRLGFQASSDHISTHISYACVITDDYSRQGIIDALKQRHCYGATDNIVLDVRMGNHLMGDDFTAERVPALEIRAQGTAPIQQVDVIRDEKYVYTARPGQAQIDLRYLDMDPAPGPRHYYVRILQQDGQIAWASPIWVTVK